MAMLAGYRQAWRGWVLGAQLRLQGSAAATASTSGRSWEQSRGVVSVDIQNNQVDKGLRLLKRKVLEEGMLPEWQRTAFYTKPSQERKLGRLETEKRLRKRGFKEKLRWITKRGERGF
jgi:small subunit ribosomal protein S21